MKVESIAYWALEVLVWTVSLALVASILWHVLFIRRRRRLRFFSAESQWWLVIIMLIALGGANTWMAASFDVTWVALFEAVFEHVGPLEERITLHRIVFVQAVFYSVITALAEIALLGFVLFVVVENIKEARARRILSRPKRLKTEQPADFQDRAVS